MLGPRVQQEPRTGLHDHAQAEGVAAPAHPLRLRERVRREGVEVDDVERQRDPRVPGVGEEGQCVVEPVRRQPVGVVGEAQAHRAPSRSSTSATRVPAGLPVERVQRAHPAVGAGAVEPGRAAQPLLRLGGQAHPRPAAGVVPDRHQRVAAVQQPGHAALADPPVAHRLHLETGHEHLDARTAVARGGRQVGHEDVEAARRARDPGRPSQSSPAQVGRRRVPRCDRRVSTASASSSPRSAARSSCAATRRIARSARGLLAGPRPAGAAEPLQVARRRGARPTCVERAVAEPPCGRARRANSSSALRIGALAVGVRGLAAGRGHDGTARRRRACRRRRNVRPVPARWWRP